MRPLGRPKCIWKDNIRIDLKVCTGFAWLCTGASRGFLRPLHFIRAKKITATTNCHSTHLGCWDFMWEQAFRSCQMSWFPSIYLIHFL